MGYTINGVTYSYDSEANQRIKQKFVNREVYSHVGTMVEYILSKSYEERDIPFSWDDVTNLYRPYCPECGDSAGFEDITAYKCGNCDEIFEEKPVTCSCYDEDDDEPYEDLFEEIDAYKCENCGHIVEDKDDLDNENAEIFEWYIVSSFLCGKLEEHGEPVISDEDIWGRTCTGQSIMLDGVITRICYEMGILEGQKYDWSEQDGSRTA